MEHAKPMLRRCAIYTRKSSEEGLEQNFNPLHAQREACEAFIKSQASDGWRLMSRPTRPRLDSVTYCDLRIHFFSHSSLFSPFPIRVC